MLRRYIPLTLVWRVQQHTFLLDIGSSNTWIGANTLYKKTSTSHDTGGRVYVEYGGRNISGKEYLDTVTLNFDLVIKNQSIGVASDTSGFDGLDGPKDHVSLHFTAMKLRGTAENMINVSIVKHGDKT